MFIRWFLLAGTLAQVAGAQAFPPDEIIILGSIDYGLTSPPIAYKSPPRYRAYMFNGRPGDHIEVSVHATRGVPKAFVTDSNLKLVAGGKARLSLTIPHASGPDTYYIIFHEAQFRPGEFKVELERPYRTDKPAR